jgi:SAM-dependent methyltransferase
MDKIPKRWDRSNGAIENVLQLTRRAINRLWKMGPLDTSLYIYYVAMQALSTAYLDFRFGRKICRFYPDSNEDLEGIHVIEPTPYYSLHELFKRISISSTDVLVDVGCGEGRVLNFWLSLGLKNKLVGIEINETVARDAVRRYRNRSNVQIICGNAIANVSICGGTIFYLFDPFSEAMFAEFERAVRGSNVRIIYCNPQAVKVFENGQWDIQKIRQFKPQWYEFDAALISPRH